jgi:hypothetical protein
MSNQAKTRLLVGLALVLAAILAYTYQGNTVLAPPAAGDSKFAPIAVENPALHLDRIERLRKLDYRASRRNIFSAELPPPEQPKAPKPRPTWPYPLPEQPAVVAPLVVPFKFYGFSADPRSGKRRAFFTNGEDVFIASEGETVQGRYRVLRIGNTTAEVEEASSGRHATLQIEQQPGGPPQG